jgi:hypothetical protein
MECVSRLRAAVHRPERIRAFAVRGLVRRVHSPRRDEFTFQALDPERTVEFLRGIEEL